MPTTTGEPDDAAERVATIDYIITRYAQTPGLTDAMIACWDADHEAWYQQELVRTQNRAYARHLQACRRCRLKWHVRQFIPLPILGRLPEPVARLVA